MDEDSLLQRIAELERRLDWLYVATGHGYASSAPPAMTTTGGAVSAAVLDLVRQGNKIGAIKQYREETGLGLREAKDVIDGLG
jgi:large subunit ribosomal protein L7/L12